MGPRFRGDDILCARGPMPIFNSFFLGGFESSTQRRRDGVRLDLIASTEHDVRAAEDYALMAAHGIRTVRDAARWHLIEGLEGHYSFASLLPQVRAAQAAGTQVIWDLFHYGMPNGVDMFAPAFVDRFAAYAKAVAQLIKDETDTVPFFTPVNEISFFAWAAGDVGVSQPVRARARRRGQGDPRPRQHRRDRGDPRRQPDRALRRRRAADQHPAAVGVGRAPARRVGLYGRAVRGGRFPRRQARPRTRRRAAVSRSRRDQLLLQQPVGRPRPHRLHGRPDLSPAARPAGARRRPRRAPDLHRRDRDRGRRPRAVAPPCRRRGRRRDRRRRPGRGHLPVPGAQPHRLGRHPPLPERAVRGVRRRRPRTPWPPLADELARQQARFAGMAKK